ncbi:ANTAR domain-containing protein [Pseudonocardia nematodicida]|uniref:ANTAR domain-containing protein n=1 Tax=Pseudonocardia nematodicida TaxID=1206997 RepID=A0ABV1KH71_9PSEU
MLSGSCGSSDARVLRACRDDLAFRATRSPYLLLDRDLRMIGANPAYLVATLRTPDELDERSLFDVFPDNPALTGADGVANLGASLARVLRTGRRDHMPVQRYDVPAPAGGPGFVQRVWVPVNSPVRDPDGRLVGVLHHVEDVTGLLVAEPAPAEDPGGTAAAVLARTLGTENLALRSRFDRHASIEQAKGVLMAQRGCSADEAFTLLRTLSHDTNTKLHLVAEALLADMAARRAEP